MKVKTKENWKQIGRIAFVFLFICSVLFHPLQLVKTQAATAHMKSLGVNFDLKPNKTFTYKSYYAGLGLKNQKVKLTNYKIQDAKKKGYNKLTFTVNFDCTLSKSSLSSVELGNADLGCGFGGYAWVTAVDYNTGKNLELKNSHNVKMTVGDWKFAKTNSYTSKDGYTFEVYNKKINVCVIYPKTYTGLCIGVGGATDTFSGTLSYDEGIVPFGKGKDGVFQNDLMYSNWKGKQVKALSHFMRVK